MQKLDEGELDLLMELARDIWVQRSEKCLGICRSIMEGPGSTVAPGKSLSLASRVVPRQS